MIRLPPQVNTALTMLHAAGYEGYLVGGAVRDSLRGQANVKDWDITTNALPEQVIRVFAHHRVLETGLKHGTVTVLLEGEALEITTYRIDGTYSDHRRPDQVCFTGNLEEDLLRRDFTVNALAYTPEKGVVDLVGGVDDLRANLLRCVGDPDRRFQEDALRIFRAVRFASVYGMEVERNTASAMHRNREQLSLIAPERLLVELNKTLCGQNAAKVLQEYADIFAVILPELRPMFGFEQHNPHHDRDVWQHTVAVVAGAAPVAVLRWAALLHDIGKPHCFSMGQDGIGHFYGHAEKSTALAEEITRRLRFDNVSRERIVRLVRYHDMPIMDDKKQLRRLLSKHGEEVLRQLIALHRADTLGQSAICRDRLQLFADIEKTLDTILSEEHCFSLRDLAINGNDLLSLGLRGPGVGEMLNTCLTAVLEEQIPNRREELIAFVRCFTEKQHRD